MLAVAWKGLGWFLGSVAATLALLMVPLQVAAERKKLDRSVSEIAQAQRDIRALETEFETRANIAQLERWNGDTLRLAAPVAAQFMPDEAALAQVDFNGASANGTPVQMAALVVPSHPGLTAALPDATPAPMTVAVAAVAPAAEPSIANAVTQVRTAAVKHVKAQAVAMLDRQLLSDSMLGDLASGASMEAGARR